jgi:hypothetical protein
MRLYKVGKGLERLGKAGYLVPKVMRVKLFVRIREREEINYSEVFLGILALMLLELF